MSTSRSCNTCNETNPSSFYKLKNGEGRLYYKCKKCHAKYISAWRKKNVDSVRLKERKLYASKSKTERRNSHLKKTYGITLAEFNIILNLQKFKCAICEEVRHSKTKPLYVDHDHRTGKIRGLLCKECNVGLGNFTDSAAKLTKAIAYLKGINSEQSQRRN